MHGKNIDTGLVTVVQWVGMGIIIEQKKIFTISQNKYFEPDT